MGWPAHSNEGVSPLPGPAPRRILVRGPTWVGDLVMATPGFRALRAAYPQAHITLQIPGPLAPLLDGSPWFDALRPLPPGGGRGLALLGEGLALRRERFDLGVCLPDSFRAALLMALGGVGRRVGYAVPGRRLLLHVPVPPPPARRGRRLWPREQHVLGLMAAAGAPAQGTHLELFVTPHEEARARTLLGARGGGTGRPRAVLAPGASYGPAKCWPPESFAALGDALVEAGAEVLLVGAPAEAERVREVAGGMRRAAVDLSRELDLGALKAVLRGARLLVCNDAGARHVAVAFGVPTLVLLGPTSLAKTAWNLQCVTPLAARVACRPCYHRVCPTDHRCMQELPPGRVIEVALETWARSPKEEV